MKLTLKTTIIYSTLIAAGLNVWQVAGSYQQRQTALAAGDTLAAATSAMPPTAVDTAAHPPQAQSNDEQATTAIASRLLQAGLKADHAALYLAVQKRTGTPWQILAAVHRIESGQSGTTAVRSYAGATGPMQFMPATFRHYALDGNGDQRTDATNLEDAMYTAGRYLAASGADKGKYSKALYNYNHSSSYVAQVLAIARRLDFKD